MPYAAMYYRRHIIIGISDTTFWNVCSVCSKLCIRLLLQRSVCSKACVRLVLLRSVCSKAFVRLRGVTIGSAAGAAAPGPVGLGGPLAGARSQMYVILNSLNSQVALPKILMYTHIQQNNNTAQGEGAWRWLQTWGTGL